MTHTTVLTAILVGGVLAVIVATIADARSARRVEAAVRAANGLEPHPKGRPDYVTAEQLEAGAPTAIQTDDAFERELADRLAQPDVTELPILLAGEQFASHTGGRLITEQPAVLVCVDDVTELRELLPVLREFSGEANTDPLIIAAAGFSDNVINTLTANRLTGTINVSAICAEPTELQTLAQCLDAVPVDIALRRSGGADGRVLGHAALFVTDRHRTLVVAQAAEKE